MNDEILNKAKNCRSYEELLNIAREGGMPDFTEENAKEYFDLLHKSGELSDDEMDVSAGGCAVRSHNQKMVSGTNCCGHWTCEMCNDSRNANNSFGLKPRSYYKDEEKLFRDCNNLEHGKGCANCYYCSYERGAWWCNNKPHYSE